MLFFLEPLSPLPRLVIAGAGHIGRAVAHLGHLLDFEVTVIDDRAEFANRERLPEVDTIVLDDIGRAVAEFPSAPDTYFVIVTRGHRDDAGALRACIKLPAAYVGMIGSRRKISLMREEFIAREWATAREFDRVHAPIGLPIGSKTVEEIGVSIAAELVQVRSGRTGEKAVRDR
jgi:xanthine dehydrogenase accessory factor